jgi:hypothetical protein
MKRYNDGLIMLRSAVSALYPEESNKMKCHKLLLFSLYDQKLATECGQLGAHT